MFRQWRPSALNAVTSSPRRAGPYLRVGGKRHLEQVCYNPAVGLEEAPARRGQASVSSGRAGPSGANVVGWDRRRLSITPGECQSGNRRGMMKYLLTSAGIKNASIHNALVELLGKPIAECDALCIPTAVYGHPMAGPRNAWRFISGQEPNCPMVGLGWKSMGVLELTALPSLGEERWVPLVRETDVLLVEGGDAAYLCHWMRASGLADLLPSLSKTVWVGLSAGS